MGNMPAPVILHPAGVGEILDGAIYLYRKNFLTLIRISGVIAVPFLLLQIATSLLFIPSDPFFVGQAGLNNLNASLITLATYALSLLLYLLRGIVGLFQVGALAFAVSELRMGREVTLSAAYHRALSRWTSLLGAGVLIELATGIGLILYLVVLFSATVFPSILSVAVPSLALVSVFLSCLGFLLFIPWLFMVAYLNTRWSVTTQSIMLENLGATQGMGRSWRLIKGSLWRTLFTIVVVSLFVWVISYLATFGLQFAAMAFFPGSLVLSSASSSIGSVVAGAIFEPLSTAVVTLYYYDLRMRREGYDLRLALDQLREPTTPALAGAV